MCCLSHSLCTAAPVGGSLPSHNIPDSRPTGRREFVLNKTRVIRRQLLRATQAQYVRIYTIPDRAQRSSIETPRSYPLSDTRLATMRVLDASKARALLPEPRHPAHTILIFPGQMAPRRILHPLLRRSVPPPEFGGGRPTGDPIPVRHNR